MIKVNASRPGRTEAAATAAAAAAIAAPVAAGDAEDPLAGAAEDETRLLLKGG